MNDMVVFLGMIKTLEPVIINDKYNRGGFFRSLPYIPSSTISGALISNYFRENKIEGDLYENITQRYVWLSHAFPWDEEKSVRLNIADPLPLPLTTLARFRIKEDKEKKEEKYVSTAILAAEIIDKVLLKDYRIKNFKNLDFKVGTLFLSNKGFQRPYILDVYTHVSLNFKSRVSKMVRNKEKRGFLYTTENIPIGKTFIFKGFVDKNIYDWMKKEAKIKIGSHRNKGYGEVEVKVLEKMNIDKYREERRRSIEVYGEYKYTVLDVVTYASPQFLEDKLGSPIYQRSKRSCFKTWLNEEFYIYRNIVTTGSVFVYRNKKSVDEYVKLETTPPGNAISRLHGLNMIFFNNPIHFERWGEIIGKS